ncbi:alpha/beta hydrolase [Rhodococcoides yunnanense]|uniref:alpha/beta hydrolase n=1 Tax=Rhodococcoides yunnanense TaxID=278209 RepID=UPI000933F458|nr:alpha/beta hydrolase [Rhodococcus yunnanensis]
MTYSIDPEIAPWVSMIPSHDPTDYVGLRKLQDSITAQLSIAANDNIDIRDITVLGPDSAPDVPVRIYTPRNADGVLPCLVYIHGGAYIAGNVQMFDGDCSRIADTVGAVVISVDYRLAPENPFPAPVEDCYAALLWASKSADELRIDVTRLAVGGGSAGGGLAAAVALIARDRGGPALCFQYLGIPQLDDRLDTPSMRDYTDTPMLTRQGTEFSWDSYLGAAGIRGTDSVSPYAAAARATDLTGLPPAYVTACQFDPLRDEGIDYAQRLAHANVPTELALYPGTFHGSTLVQQAAVSKRQEDDLTAALRRAFGIPPR